MTRYLSVVAGVCVIFLSTAAHAGLTGVNQLGGDEDDLNLALAKAVNNAYFAGNGSIGPVSAFESIQSSVTFSIDEIAFECARIPDSDGDVPLKLDGTNVGQAGVNDRIWQAAGDVIGGRVVASYNAANDASFHIGDAASSFGTRLFKIPESTAGSTAAPVAPGLFTIGATPAFSESIESSDPSSAVNNGEDFFVTFALKRAGQFDSFLVGYEDTSAGDKDFNDLILQLSSSAQPPVIQFPPPGDTSPPPIEPPPEPSPGGSQPPVVPLPSAVFPGLALLVGLVLRAKKR